MVFMMCTHLALGPGAMGVHIYQAIRQTTLVLAWVTVQLLTLTCSATVTCNYLCIMAKQHV